MAHLIQPCCAHKHLSELRSKLGEDGTEKIEGYGDLSLNELLPPLVTHYTGTMLLIAAPSLPDQATDIIKRCMTKEWTHPSGRGRIPAVTHLTVVADLSEGKSPAASQWLKENPWGGRLTLVDREQEETAILLPDFAITGPVNMRYGHHFEATATTKPETVRALWAKFARTAEPEKPAVAEKPEAPAAPKPKRKSRKKDAAV